jgi:hypothetical protein
MFKSLVTDELNVKGSEEELNGFLSMEKKRDLLQKKLDEDLQVETAMKLQINREFEELKHLEVSVEKRLEQKHSAKQFSIKH